jgi:hypothetical protein
MEVGIGGHEGFDAFEVTGCDGLPYLTGCFEVIDVVLELGPAWEPVLAGNLELRIGQGLRCAGTDEVLGLITKMSEIRAFGKLHWRNPFFMPVVRMFGRKVFRTKRSLEGWASTLSADRLRPSRRFDNSTRREVRPDERRCLKLTLCPYPSDSLYLAPTGLIDVPL